MKQISLLLLIFSIPLTMIIVGSSLDTVMICDYNFGDLIDLCLKQKSQYTWSLVLGGFGILIFECVMLLHDYNKTQQSYPSVEDEKK